LGFVSGLAMTNNCVRNGGFSCFIIKRIVMNSAGMFRKEIGYIKNIFVHIYKRRQEILDGSLPGLTKRLSSEGLYRVLKSAYKAHYAVYEIFGGINSSEIASKLDKVELYFNKVELYFDKVELYFDRVELYFDKVELYFDRVDIYFSKVELYFDKVDVYFDKVDDYFDKVDVYFSKVEGKFDKVDVYFLAMGGSEKLGVDNENFWDKRSRDRKIAGIVNSSEIATSLTQGTPCVENAPLPASLNGT
jgi:hypothetical protein